jgi:hypothetical protein
MATARGRNATGKISQARSVGKNVENRLPQTMGFGAFPHAQRVPSISPPLPPDAHLVAVETDLRCDVFVEHPGEPEQNDGGPLGEAVADGPGLAEFLQEFLLPFRDDDLRSVPSHGRSPENRETRQNRRCPTSVQHQCYDVALATLFVQLFIWPTST